jgi:hypothetical protein
VLHDDGKAGSVALELTDSQLTVQQMTEKILNHLNEIERLIQTARERRNTADSDR